MKRLLLILLITLTALSLSACVETVIEPDEDPIDVTTESLADTFLKLYFGGGKTVISVTEDITLPETYQEASIVWFSYNQDVIANDGTIHRPAFGESAINVVVSFTMYADEDTFNDSIEFSVQPLDEVIMDWGYYEGAQQLSGESLKTFLHQLIDDHDMLTYSELWTALAYTDEDPNNPDNVLLLYSEISMDKDSKCSATCPNTASWNREHVWPKSHGGFDTGDIEGTDLHHIRPSLVIVNGDRGNLDFDEGGTLQDYTEDSYRDSDSFEPADTVKGDVARMMFYMAVRYEGDSGELDFELNDNVNNSGPYLGKLSVLMEWHLNDLPDAFEIQRNNRIYEEQGNRNPFIDHPMFAELIWGS